MNILVSYFSPAAKTATIAHIIADEVKGDIFKIQPKRPYTEADLKWTNPFARCNRERLSKRGVPIVDKIVNFHEYQVFIIGFPLWDHAEPKIIDTFFDSYYWRGKDIYLFATSGRGDLKKIKNNLQSISAVTILSATVLNDVKQVIPWLDTLAI